MIYSIIISFVLAFTSPAGLVFSAQAKQVKKTPSKRKVKKINRGDLSLRVFAAAKNRWVLHELLKKKLSKADAAFLRSKTRQLKVKLRKKLNITYLSSKRAFNIKGYKSLFYVSKNGKNLKYKNKIFTAQKSKSLKAKLKYIQKILKSSTPKKFSLMDLFISTAYAEGPYEGSLESASLDILMLLNYLEVYGNGDDPYSVLLYVAENEPNALAAIRRLYETNGRKAIKGITCDNDFRMTLHFDDGSFSALNWNGTQGSGARAELSDNTNGNWNPVSFYFEDEMTQALNAQFFFCQMMEGQNNSKGIAVISGLNEMINPMSFDEDYSGENSSSDALE